MTSQPTDPFDKRFAARVQSIREAMEWTQRDMADVLGIPLERYKKYEVRTPLPHRLVARFCKVTGVPEGQLFDLDVPVARLSIRRPAAPHHSAPRH